MTLQQGEMVHNRYRILHRMGDTNYRAMDMSLRQACIVKEFTGTTSERITQLASLQHPRLPRIIDLVNNGDQSLLVMDLIEGANLPERMFETDDPTPDGTIWTWLEQLVETLTYLHGQTPPVAHGNISLDTVTIRPNGGATLTDFATHEKEPAADIKALGHIVGFLVSDTHPPQTDAELLAKLEPLPGRLPELAKELLNGTISKVEDVLTNRSSPADAPATTFLAGTIGNPADSKAPSTPQKDEPVMPWDRPSEQSPSENPQAGPGTIVWGERAADSVRTDGPSDLTQPPAEPAQPVQPKKPVAEPKPTVPDSPPTRIVGANAPPTQASPIHEIPQSQPVRAQASAAASKPVAQTAAQPSAAAEKPASGFNWLWIVVGVMAGIILLCLATVGFVAWNWDEIIADPTAEARVELVPDPEGEQKDGVAPVVDEPESTTEPIPTLAPTVAVEVLDPTPEQVNQPEPEPTEEQVNQPEPEPTEEQVNQPEPEPTEEQVNVPVEENLDENQDEEVNAPANEPANDPIEEASGDLGGVRVGDVYRNEELGFVFVIPEEFVILGESEGTITLGRNVAGADESILLQVVPRAGGASAELLMDQIETQIPESEGQLYGRLPATFDELSGFSQTSTIFETDDNPILIGEIYTLENDEAAVLVIASLASGAEVRHVVLDIMPEFLTNLDIYVGTAYTSQ